jgi:uncharacterized protein YggE
MKTTLTIITLATILTACATLAASSPPTPPHEAVSEDWIQISGAAAVTVAADRAMVSFTMETLASDASEEGEVIPSSLGYELGALSKSTARRIGSHLSSIPIVRP